MHPFDIFILVLFGISIVIGIFQGLWRLLTGWFSIAFSILLAYNLSPRLKIYLPKFIPFPHLLTFFFIFLISIIIFALLLKAGKKAIKNLGLSFWDKLFGSLFLFLLSILFILAIVHLLETLGFSSLIKGAKIPEILLEIESRVLERIK